MHTTIHERANALAPKLIDIRRLIHRHPELGFREIHTAGLVADFLNLLGIEIKTGVAKTGVVGNLGTDGPIVALRADMDALPIQELNQVVYASEVPGVMHACGHDVHTTCLLGAAMLLKDMQLSGRVRFLFQPSEEGMDEEGKSGAWRMVEEGAFEQVQAVFGLHVDSKFASGVLACSPGYILAALDNFKIDILGRAAHGAQAYLGVDAISLAAQVVSALHTIVSRRVPALESAVLSIGMIQGGSKENNLAEQVELRGTIRTFDPKIRQKVIDEMHKACSIARVLGGDYQLTMQTGYPSLCNDSTLAAFARDLAAGLVGAQAVEDIQPEMGSEDFSFYTQKSPGCYLSLGVRPPGQPMRPLHNPNFDVDESVIPLGAAVLAELAYQYLEKKPLENLL
jgi:amidohydrolase